MEDRSGIALEAMSDAVHAIAGERAVEPVLQRIVAASRVLAGARYAALGIPDGQGNFAQFITAGMSEELIAAMGPLPRTHGLLGAMLDTDRPYRTEDIKQDPRFRGWWPSAHPLMASFLGVPIRSREGILGALYLTDKEDAPGFTEEDEGLIRMLAAHAAIAIENARLYERGRELSFVEERNRLACDRSCRSFSESCSRPSRPPRSLTASCARGRGRPGPERWESLTRHGGRSRSSRSWPRTRSRSFAR
jgi:GAF domain-containing protein